MKPNVGGLDRTLRMIAGLILLIVGIFIVKSSGWMAIFIGLGAIIFLTGLFRFCALYTLCGADTCPSKTTLSN
jgi:hypothetical protein